MKKTSKAAGKPADDLRTEYRFDYSRSKPNRFARFFTQDSVAVVLEPDVASIFSSSESVNRLLRSVIAALPKRAVSERATRRKKG